METGHGNKRMSLIKLRQKHDKLMAKVILFDNLKKINSEYRGALDRLEAFKSSRENLISSLKSVQETIPQMERMVFMDSVISEVINSPSKLAEYKKKSKRA